MSKQCYNCIYANKRVEGLPEGSMRCQVNPPTVVPTGAGAAAYWPSVNANDFCGEFSPDTESMLRNQASESVRCGRITRLVDPIERPQTIRQRMDENADALGDAYKESMDRARQSTDPLCRPIGDLEARNAKS